MLKFQFSILLFFICIYLHLATMSDELGLTPAEAILEM